MLMESALFEGDGVRLAADALGDPAAPPVIFLHGGGQSRRSWHGSAERVASAGYYALCVDLRGHGESGWAANGDYALDAFVRDVERLLATFERPVALVGASRGGQAALVGGARHPRRVRMIMLADVAPGMAETGVEKIRAFFRASEDGFASVEEAAEMLAQHRGLPRKPDASGLAKALRRDESGRLFWHWDPQTVSPAFTGGPAEDAAMRDAAARVTGPVILVRGELSDLVTPESVRLFRALTPQLEVVEAAGAGHMFTGDRNEVFAETLLAHLARFMPLKP
jgi:pimeloyl-ACP methyl ester carboxylesterase